MAEQKPTSNLASAMGEFRRSVEITRDVRFQANLRLTARSTASAYTISFLSTYVIALSLIPNIIQLEHYQNQMLLACSIVLSVFVIFTSLIDASKNFYHYGELLHACARKVATIHHELRLVDITQGEEMAGKEFRELEKRYQVALDDCPVNHDNMDFYLEMAIKPHLFEVTRGSWPVFAFVIWNRVRAASLRWLWLMPHLIVSISVGAIVYIFVLRDAVQR